ncbi:MAG: hypothetical protein L3K18_09520 [Thermoplasmata archaeon]|nr:hypothetical protein [Thermoplasmata archaeon]
MPRILSGGAYRLVTLKAPSKVSALIGSSGPNRAAWRVTLMCPDGSDPNVPANVDTVFVGPNGSTAVPLGPGKARTFTAVNPWMIGISCATLGQVVFIDWGGEPPAAGD